MYIHEQSVDLKCFRCPKYIILNLRRSGAENMIVQNISKLENSTWYFDQGYTYKYLSKGASYNSCDS